jgi:hypothetical protein
MNETGNKALKLILVCVLCIGLVAGLAYLIQLIIS